MSSSCFIINDSSSYGDKHEHLNNKHIKNELMQHLQDFNSRETTNINELNLLKWIH